MSNWFTKLFSRKPKGKRLGYVGAATGRLQNGWVTANPSIEAITDADLARLRARSRHLCRNNPLIAQAQTAFGTGLIGSGVAARSATGSQTIDKRVDALWADVVREIDAEGIQDLAGLQLTAFNTMFAGGEAIIRRRWRQPDDGLTVPFQIQVLPAEYLDISKTEDLADGGRIVQGVEFGSDGRRRAYWLFRDHPDVVWSGESVRVPAEDVAHVYEVREAGQVRGIPWPAPVISQVYALEEYREAERVRKRIEACTVAFVSSPDGTIPFPETASTTDADGNPIGSLNPGAILNVRDGTTVTMGTPAQVWGFPDYVKTEVQAIASGLRITYALLSGNLKDVNYSSIRYGALAYKAVVQQIQRTVIEPLMMRPIWRWFIEAAIASGKLRARDYPVKFVPPVFEEIDRVKEANADVEEVKAGLASLQDVLARRGQDWRKVLSEQAKVQEEARRLGLVLSVDLAAELQSKQKEPVDG